MTRINTLLIKRVKTAHLIWIVGIIIITILSNYEFAIAQNAKISETERVIETYPFADPNPIPVLSGAKSHIYPYFTFDGYTHESNEQVWKVVKLENEYIEVFILPEVGGKIWGAIEKSTGEEFIYRNEVLKFRNIALRGPWTSGGIEFNFGTTGHTPAAATPVDYTLSENEDGSVSCTVGGYDLATRTEWRVKITLPKDKAYFETESSWYNPSKFNQSYYNWSNAAIRASEDLQFYFPGTHYIGHSGNAGEWPIDQRGRNLSLYRNNDFGPNKSYHILGERTEFYGAYWEDKDFGFGNWSLYSDMPGKKLWIWSLARSGAIWEDLLTDNDGQYVEVQSGRLFSQATGSSITTPFDYAGFEPYRFDKWKEYWYPVVEIGGITQASPFGVLEIEELGSQSVIKLMALQELDNDLKVSLNGRSISNNKVDLGPMEVYRDTVNISSKQVRDLEIVLGDNLLIYNPSESEVSFDRPLRSHPSDEDDSAGRFYNLAKNQMYNRQYKEALENLNKVIDRDPAHLDAYADLAHLYYWRGEYGKALEYTETALSYNTYHPKANYVHGIVNEKLGYQYKALEALGWASRSYQYRSAAYTAMAEIYLQMHQMDRAIEFAHRALQYDRNNVLALNIQAIGYRLNGNLREAQSTLNQTLNIDPLNHFANFERYLLNKNDESLNNFQSNITNELPHETYLELAVRYSNLGLKSDAIAVLDEAPKQAMVWFWLAYLTSENETEQSSTYLQRAIDSSSHLVFPYRNESLPVLNWAKQQSDSWKFGYYMGLIYWHKGQLERAYELFNELEREPDPASFYVARGNLLKELNSLDEEIGANYEIAKQLNPSDWRSWNVLTNYYLDTNKINLALNNSKEAYSTFSDRDAIELNYAKTLLINGLYEQSISVLTNMQILPFENASEGRVLFANAQTLLALEEIEAENYDEALDALRLAQTWPEHLGVGRPFNPDLRLQLYLESSIYKSIEQVNKAQQLDNQIIDYTRNNPNSYGLGHYYGILTLMEYDRPEEAFALMENWYKEDPSSLIAEWAYARLSGDEKQLELIRKEIEEGNEMLPSQTLTLIKSEQVINTLSDY